MPWRVVFAKLGEARSIIGGIILISGVVVSALGMLKVPAQQAVIASKIEEHNKTAAAQTDQTNRKLDVLICLQAKLDTPIRCVARERQ
jgi:hypothetical protein